MKEYKIKLSFSELTIQIGRVGEDYQILLQGGERPHIGCTVLAVPRPSLTGSGACSSTASVLNLPGHKDEALCRLLAERAVCPGKCSGSLQRRLPHRRDYGRTDPGSV